MTWWQIAVGAWLVWCLAAAAGSAWFVPDGAASGLFRVCIPPAVKALLTPVELAAVIAHEEGHLYHRHALRNLGRICFFIWPSTARLQAQERAADDYAAARGHAAALASALYKLGRSPDDFRRALRLARRGGVLADGWRSRPLHTGASNG